MDLKSLQCFVQVSELRSFSKAAAAAGMTQPSFSRLVAGLERHFGAPLFFRTGRGVALTDLGEATLPRAKMLLVQAEQLSADIRDRQQTPSGVVTLGILPSLVQPLATALFKRARAHFPGIRLHILEAFSDQIERWIAQGRADIGLLARYRAVRRGKEDVLLRSNLVLVGPPQRRPLPRRIEFDRMIRLPLVLPGSPNGLRLLLEDVARKRGGLLNLALEADSITAQKEVVRRCACYTVLTPEAIGEEQAAGLLTAQQIVKPELGRLTIVTTTTQRPLSRAAREVLKTILDLAHSGTLLGGKPGS